MEAFKDLLYDENEVEEERKKLRFGMGQTVKCKVGPRSWKKGKVTEHDEEIIEPGYIAPYLVTLLNGDVIFAPSRTQMTSSVLCSTARREMFA
jgi:hypothetical protein